MNGLGLQVYFVVFQSMQAVNDGKLLLLKASSPKGRSSERAGSDAEINMIMHLTHYEPS